MIAIRFRQIALLLLAMAISLLAFFQMFERTTGSFPMQYALMLGAGMVLYLVLWGLMLRFQPYASQTIMPCVLLLTAIGTAMIARIDQAADTAVAFRQLIWMCLALVLCGLLVVFMRDYRVLRRFSYVSMVVGLVLLLSPMIPGLGMEIQGARIWINIFGLGTIQPGEFAKLFLAFFFAAYLFDHRDQLAVGGRKFLGLQLPRIKDMGPIIIVWLASMGVLVLQHDLGTSLMFFAMFVSMLYVATGRKSWIIIGVIASRRAPCWPPRSSPMWVTASTPGCAPSTRRSTTVTPAVRRRSSAACSGWPRVDCSAPDWVRDTPSLTPLANSDFIYASLGEELGLSGLLAVLMRTCWSSPPG